MQADFAMGQEGERGEYGLCNAVLLSKPRSRFAVRWIALFNEVFDARIWSMHSVKYPLFAAALWPSDITVRATRVARARFPCSALQQLLGGSSFFRPLWDNLQCGWRPSCSEKTSHFAQVPV